MDREVFDNTNMATVFLGICDQSRAAVDVDIFALAISNISLNIIHLFIEKTLS